MSTIEMAKAMGLVEEPKHPETNMLKHGDLPNGLIPRVRPFRRWDREEQK